MRAALAAAAPAGVPVLVNDRVDVALAAGAHGVHIGQGDLPCAAVRRLVGSSLIVGVSCKTAEQAVAAARAGADYVGVGAVYPTNTKDSKAIGVDGLAAVVRASPIPVVAIGGLKAHNVAPAMQAGAAGVAVVTALFAADDIAAATADVLAAVNAAVAPEVPAAGGALRVHVGERAATAEPAVVAAE